MTDQLKLCPFCGGTLDVYNPHSALHPPTDSCYFDSGEMVLNLSFPGAIAAWDTRAPVRITDAMVEAAAESYWQKTGFVIPFEDMRAAIQAALEVKE